MGTESENENEDFERTVSRLDVPIEFSSSQQPQLVEFFDTRLIL